MNSYLKPVEESALNIVFIYKDALSSTIVNNIFKQILSSFLPSGSRRIIIHVFTKRMYPHYLEDFREFIQSNILYSVTTRYYDLSIDKLEEVLSKLRSSCSLFFVYVDKNLVDVIDYLRNREYSVTVV